MTNTKTQVAQHLSTIIGLQISNVCRAADMLTLQFGPLKQRVDRKGTAYQVGAWALHVQCTWQIECESEILATHVDLRGSNEEVSCAVDRIYDLLVTSGRAHVETVSADESGGISGEMRLLLSNGLCIVITPNNVADEEDWRFFSPHSDAPHFVIGGGRAVEI